MTFAMGLSAKLSLFSYSCMEMYRVRSERRQLCTRTNTTMFTYTHLFSRWFLAIIITFLKPLCTVWLVGLSRMEMISAQHHTEPVFIEQTTRRRPHNCWGPPPRMGLPQLCGDRRVCGPTNQPTDPLDAEKALNYFNPPPGARGGARVWAGKGWQPHVFREKHRRVHIHCRCL
jgi:hypothetical protein